MIWILKGEINFFVTCLFIFIFFLHMERLGKKMPQNPDLEMSLFSLCPCWRKAFMRGNAYRQQAHRDQDPPKSRPGTWEAKVHLLPVGLEIFHVFEGSSFPKLGLVSLKRGGIGDWLTHVLSQPWTVEPAYQQGPYGRERKAPRAFVLGRSRSPEFLIPVVCAV